MIAISVIKIECYRPGAPENYFKAIVVEAFSPGKVEKCIFIAVGQDELRTRRDVSMQDAGPSDWTI